MARIGFNFDLVPRSKDRHTQATNRFRIVTVFSSPSSGPKIARLLRIKSSLSRDSTHANCIGSAVIMKSSPCTNPHNSRSRQHTISGDQAPMTKPLSTITRCHFFLPIRRCFSCTVQRHQEFSDQVFARHLLFRWQHNRHLTCRFCLTVCPGSIHEQDLPSGRTICPGFPHQRFGEQEHYALERSHRCERSWHRRVPAF